MTPARLYDRGIETNAAGMAGEEAIDPKQAEAAKKAAKDAEDRRIRACIERCKKRDAAMSKAALIDFLISNGCRPESDRESLEKDSVLQPLVLALKCNCECAPQPPDDESGGAGGSSPPKATLDLSPPSGTGQVKAGG